MADETSIEWADSTFNPWMGCTKVSPACDHCYAERDTARFGRVGWGPGAPRMRTSLANWKMPLQWNAKKFAECACGWRGVPKEAGSPFIYGCPDHFYKCAACGHSSTLRPARRRVFCASLADVFDNEVDVAWLADLLDLMSRTPELDWLLLTKRIGNFMPRLRAARAHLDNETPVAYPLPVRHWVHNWIHGDAPKNVWLGATICNQGEADRDIPKLLTTPAAVRFLSIEPMLGPVNLGPWISPAVYCGSCGEHYPPSEAMPDPDGHPHGADKCARCGQENVMGTWWGWDAINEASRPDGMDLDAWDHGYKLHWVICGGESGPQARPVHPDWVRDLRDQCAEAGVPFLFKQWGEWRPINQGNADWYDSLYQSNVIARESEDQGRIDEAYGRRCRVPTSAVHADGSVHDLLDPGAFQQGSGAMQSFKVGKKLAGRALDGHLHSAWPGASHTVGG